MISGRKNALGIALIVLLMGITGGVILRGQPLSLLGAALKQLRPQYILLALGSGLLLLMLAFLRMRREKEEPVWETETDCKKEAEIV